METLTKDGELSLDEKSSFYPSDTGVHFVYFTCMERSIDYTAAEKGNVNQVKAILDRKPELINSKGQFGLTPLHCAAMKNQLAVAELLISRKADVNARDKKGDTPLRVAMAQARKEVADFLISKGSKE